VSTGPGRVQEEIDRDKAEAARRHGNARRKLQNAQNALQRSSAFGNLHEAAIRMAVAEGKPVPPEVLAEYPHLAPAGMEAPPVSPPEVAKVTPGDLQERARQLANDERRRVEQEFAAGQRAENYRPSDFEYTVKRHLANLVQQHAADLSEDDFVRLMR